MKPTTFFIALLSGLASAMLFAGLALQSSAAVGLALAAPIPVAIVGLGWGPAAGYIAAIVGPILIYALTQTTPSAVTLAVALTLPIAFAAHLAQSRLAPAEVESTPQAPRPNMTASPESDWFPLPRILFVITVTTFAACVFLGWLLDYDPAQILPALTESLTRGAEELDPAARVQLENAARLVVGLVPLIQPAVLTLVLVICLYVASFIARSSGRLFRPKDDIPAFANLPKASLLPFALALAGTLLDGTGGLVATVFVGAFGTAFALVGLARFHRKTRERPGRGLILFVTYTAIVILTFPLLIFVVLGIAETWRTGDHSASPRS